MTTLTSICIPSIIHARLQRLARDAGRPIDEFLETLLDDYEKRLFFAQLEEDFTRLRADPVASADYDAEQAVWDATLLDGLDEY